MNQSQVAQISDAEKITGFHRSTLRRWWNEGKFPAPHKLNGTTLVWPIETLKRWIKENIPEASI